MLSGKFIQCPFCSVIFVHLSDLALHLARFSDKADFHRRNVICLRCRVEHQDLGLVDGVENWTHVDDCPLRKSKR